MAFEARSSQAIIPPPPRFTGDQESDYRALIQWAHSFYEAGVVESGLFDPEYQASGAEEIDYSALPDPQATTIARAQAVANASITRLISGSFTVSDADTSASVTFSDELSSAEYKAIASPSAFDGSPAANAFSVASINKATTGAAFTLVAAPGAGHSVTFDYLILITLE